MNKIYAPLNQVLIDRLILLGIVPTEHQRRQLNSKRSQTTNSDEDSLSSIFGRIELQPLPEGFAIQGRMPTQRSPRGEEPNEPTERLVNSLDTNPLIVNEQDDSELWVIDHNDQVLVAQLSGPTRWSQANFSVSTFTNFFGATPEIIIIL